MAIIWVVANIQIVTLAPEEWQLYKEIRLEALLEEPQAFGSSYADTLERPDSFWQERLIEAQKGKTSWLLFAKENNQIIGMIGAFSAVASEVVDIISVYVTKEKRGFGVATALMAAILEQVRKGGTFRKAVLNVNVDQTAAVTLYRHFGFRIVGEMAGLQDDASSHSSYIMEKELNYS